MAAVATGSGGDVVHFASWLDGVRPHLKPPVANKLLYGAGQQKVMVVGGPNVRSDYHIELGEEIFYQVEGGMVLKVYERGTPRDVVIPEGHIFFLPGRIPHSPQRFANTIGLVWERERLPAETDGLRWYTAAGDGTVLYEEWFHCLDLGKELVPVIHRFQESDAAKTGMPARRYSASEQPFPLDKETTLVEAFHLDTWVREHATSAATHYSAVLCGEGAVDARLAGFEYRAVMHTGPHPDWQVAEGVSLGGAHHQLHVYVMEGRVEVHVMQGALSPAPVTTAAPVGADSSRGAGWHSMSTGTMCLVTADPEAPTIPARVRIIFSAGCRAMLVTNRVAMDDSVAAAAADGGR